MHSLCYSQRMTQTPDAIVVGAGVGGLSSALRLAGAGAQVLLLESGAEVGGKMRVNPVGAQWIDAGPTVLTMPWIFERLWADAGRDFRREVPIERLDILARHRWGDRSELDLYAQLDRSYDAICEFAGKKQGEAFLRFHRKANEIFAAVKEPFILAENNDVWSGLARTGVSGLARLAKIQWHRSLWSMLGSYFSDPRLQQLFARYATYYGSSPFQAPGTLALIAGVEMEGVWRIRGGMIELARATEKAARELGAQIECGVRVEALLRDSQGICGVRAEDGRSWKTRNVIYNGSLAQLADKICPGAACRPAKQRSLSAITLTGMASCYGMDLEFHNVLFGSDYRREFDDIFGEGRFPREPTTYLCAPDSHRVQKMGDEQRLFALLNAPATGDEPPHSISLEQAMERMNRVANPCGIKINFQSESLTLTQAKDFEQRFPGTGGALYGPATHGATGAFSRPNCESKIPGLYLAGGEIHPGAGVPMVTLGGSQCADRVMKRLALTSPSPRGATRGGISTSSARTASTR